MVNRPRYRKIKKDYQAKNLQNPFFQRKKKGSHPRRWKLLSLLIFFLFCLGIWFFLASPVWRLKKIVVSGSTRIPSWEIENQLWQRTQLTRGLVFRQSNIFLFDREEATEEILVKYNFASLEIAKKIPGTLSVTIGERPYAFIFQQGGALCYASSDGSLIKEAPVSEEDKKKYFILENQNSIDLVGTDGRIALKEEYLQFIINLAARLSAYPDQPTERYIVDQEFNAVKVKFLNGPLVYFNIKSDLNSQVERLLLVKREKIKDNFNRINYIDLRYGDRVFINPELK